MDAEWPDYYSSGASELHNKRIILCKVLEYNRCFFFQVALRCLEIS